MYQLHPHVQANRRMQADLEAMQKEMDRNKGKSSTPKPAATPAPKHPAPSPASSTTSAPKAAPKGKPAASEPASDSESDGGGEPAELSYGAKMGRLRRLCERKTSGKLNVPEEIHQRWAQKGRSRDELLEEFENCNFNKDSGSALHGWTFQEGMIPGNTSMITYSDPKPHIIYHMFIVNPAHVLLRWFVPG